MNEPKIRFKGFNGEWKKSPLKKFFSKVTERNSNLSYTAVLTNSAEYGIIDQRDYFDFDVANSSSIGGYYVVRPNDFVYNPRVSVTAPVGPINRNMLGYPGVMSPLYLVFKIEGINKDFLCHYYKTNKWHRFMRLSGNCGARFDRLSVSDDQFVKMPIICPADTNEQEIISKYLYNIDSLIAACGARIGALRQVKEASLQAMFPQEGETAPKVRFKGFTGEWRKVKLGEIFTERAESDVNGEMLSVTMHDGIIKASENGRFDNSNSDKSNYKLVLKDDIAYNSMRMWQGASGWSPYRGIVSPAYTVVTPNEGVDSKFFAFYFKTNEVIEKFRLHSQGLTKDTWNLKYPAFSKISILYPKNESEQQKIAAYFTALDRKITLQTQRLEKLKQIKAACLDKMFV